MKKLLPIGWYIGVTFVAMTLFISVVAMCTPHVKIDQSYEELRLDSITLNLLDSCKFVVREEIVTIVKADDSQDLFPTFFIIFENNVTVDYACKGEVLYFIRTGNFKYDDFLCY